MPANTCYSWNKNKAGMISGHYFEYTAESLINTIPVTPTPTPQILRDVPSLLTKKEAVL